MYVMHKDKDGAILSVKSYDHDYEFGSWIRECDFRPGDRVEFGETLKRDPASIPEPAFLEEAPHAPPPNVGADNELQPF